jgi:hypothetical protein
MKGKKAIDWKDGFPQVFIGQRKTCLKTGLMGGSFNLQSLACVEGKGLIIWK